MTRARCSTPRALTPPPSGPSSGRGPSSEAPGDSRLQKEKRWEFLAELPRSFREEHFLYVHGSARNPLNEYVFPEDIYKPAQDGAHLRAGRAQLLPGPHPRPRHLHRELAVLQPEEFDYSYASTAARRCATSAPSASRATATGGPATSCSTNDTIRYRRVEYDIDTTVKKILTPSPTWKTSSATGCATEGKGERGA